MDLNLRDKVAIITGGSQGIGKQIADVKEKKPVADLDIMEIRSILLRNNAIL